MTMCLPRDRRLPGRLRCLALLVAALLLVPAQARAADPIPAGGGNGYDLQLFHPAIDSKGYITLNASQVLGLWDFSFGLVGAIAGRPLRLERAETGGRYSYDFLVTPSLQATLGFKYAELSVSLPVQIGSGAARNPGNPEQTFSGQGLGDLGIHVKGRILNTSKHPVGLALLVSLYAPTGDSRSFLGDGGFGIAPTVIVDKEFGRSRRFRAALNVGGRFRTDGSHTFTDVVGTAKSRSLGQQATYGVAASYAVVKDRFDVLGEIYGAAALDGAKNAFPLEAIAGAKVYLARNSFFSFGGGGGLVPDQTQGALWRVFVGFVFEPAIGDKDGDTFKDDVDKCPKDPEDFDDFEDNDGCPEPDNDRDGILDPKDKCQNEPETKNGFEDQDGCPDVVELDRDGDTIPDTADRCPDDPEDRDVFDDADGCPDPDNDQDAILDIDDKCPNDPEDADGFEDQDGCPDPDNDKDRIVDVKDRCPNEPETYNGFEDQDGCPDKGRVIVRRGKLEILDKIYFETDRTIIKEISFPLLDAIAATLKGNPQILLMEIQGHADERGGTAHNIELTQGRADAIRQFLIEHGVEPERLQAKGYGETKPLCTTSDEECWSRNRRVEFVIVKRSDSAE